MTTANKPQADRVPPLTPDAPQTKWAAPDPSKMEAGPVEELDVPKLEAIVDGQRHVIDTLKRELEHARTRIAELSRPKVPLAAAGELASTQVFLARLAMRLGLKVLAYKLKPGERIANGIGSWLVTLNLPDSLGQLAFSFSDEHVPLLAGLPNTTAFPIERRDVVNEDFEALVRAMLAVCPEALKVAEESPWKGQDGSPASHERLMRSL